MESKQKWAEELVNGMVIRSGKPEIFNKSSWECSNRIGQGCPKKWSKLRMPQRNGMGQGSSRWYENKPSRSTGQHGLSKRTAYSRPKGGLTSTS